MDSADLRVKVSDWAGPRLDQLRSMALGMLGVGAVLFVIGWVMDPPRANHPGVFTSYLFAYMFWIGVTCGSLGLLMLHHTVGGGWGFLIRRFMEAGTRLFLPMAILFIPIVIALISFPLYRWAHAGPDDHIVHAKAPYLNVPFFLARAVLYFLIWGGLAWFFNKWGATQDERADPAVSNRLNVVGAGGLVLFVITITFMAVDWIMSLAPDWFSSIFGLLVVVTQGLSTLALMLALFGRLYGGRALDAGVPSGYFRDLGNLMLAFTLLWAYMSFGQYLIIYSGNLAEEVRWYLDRREGGWGVVSLLLIPFHFALPFLILLLGSHVKRSPQRLARVAGFLIFMRFVDLFWWVTPTFRDHFSLTAADIGAPLLIGGIWLWLWVGQVRDQYLVPLHDPRLEGALPGHGHGHGAVEHV
jgi:hypothetical protein